MTARKPDSAPDHAVVLSAARWPMLAWFFSGYLHEDYLADHGSPEGALRAWRDDASSRERAAFERESRELIDAAARVPFDTIAAFVRRDLGSAWRPSDRARLERLLGPPSTTSR